MANSGGSKKVPGKTISQGTGTSVQVEQLEKSVKALTLDVKNTYKRLEDIQQTLNKLRKGSK